MEECDKAVIQRKEKISVLKQYDSNRFYLKEEINNFCDLILMLSIELAEIERGIKYYFKNTVEPQKEIILYRALEVASMVGEDAEWIDIYRYGLSKKIKPREELVREYQERTGESKEDGESL